MEKIADTPLEYFICGGASGFFATFIGHPFDTVKVRVQTLPLLNKKRQTPSTIVKNIIHKEGVLGFYRGLLTPLLTILPLHATTFGVYKVFKICFGPEEHELFEPHHYFISGCLAGMIGSFLQAPGDRVKVLLQIQELEGTKQYHGAGDVLMKLYKDSGLRNVFKGVGATLLKETPANGVYFMTYEALRDGMTDHGTEMTTPKVAIVAGGAAGLVYAMMASPFDVVKNRIQGSNNLTYPRGVRDAFPELFRSEGFRGFTRGLAPVMLRAMPVNIVGFMAFEMVRQQIRGHGWIGDNT